MASSSRRLFQEPQPDERSTARSAQSPNRSSSQPPQDVALAIDIGMTSSRMIMAVNGVAPWAPGATTVITRLPQDPAPVHFRDGEFPNLGTPLRLQGSLESCLPHEPPGDTVAVPLKVLFYHLYLVKYYFLSLSSQDGEARYQNKIRCRTILQEVPQLRLLWMQYVQKPPQEQRQIDQLFEAIFVAHLKALANRALSFARRSSYTIKHIVITVPPNWDSSMQREYIKLLERVWKDVEITTISEIDGVAHWLAYMPLNFWFRKSVNEVAAVDFGGHTMSYYRFDLLANKRDKQFSFYRSGNYQCYHGGSDYYASCLMEHLHTLIAQRFAHLSEAERAYMLEDGMRHYRTNHRASINGGPYVIQASKDENTGSEVFHITEKLARDFFYASFDRPRRMLEQLLRRLPQGSVVIMVGGTLMNHNVSNLFKKTIEAAGMICRTAADLEMRADERPYTVARGAAFAAQGQIPVEDFIKSCSIAINPRNLSKKIPVIMHRGTPIQQEVVIPRCPDGGATHRVEISIRPQLDTPELDNAVDIERDMTYVLRSLQMHAGAYSCDTKLYPDEDNPQKGTLEIRFTMTRDEPKRQGTQLAYRWPVYFAIGHRVVLIDLDAQSPPEKEEPYPEAPPMVKRGLVRTFLDRLWSGDWVGSLSGVQRELENPGSPKRTSRSSTAQLQHINIFDRQHIDDEDVYISSDDDESIEEEIMTAATPMNFLRPNMALGTPGSALQQATPIRTRIRQGLGLNA